MGFISRFILPKEIDFNAALQKQAQATLALVTHIHTACVENDVKALDKIIDEAKQSAELKSQNMKELLDVLITPYDKESIFRMITQLDWIALSVKHFRLEIEVYDLHSLHDYRSISGNLVGMSKLLEEGISQLPSKNLQLISLKIDQILELYDQVITQYARASANLLAQNDFKRIIRHKEMLMQLKEIAKRIHITANTLEDMAIKVI